MSREPASGLGAPTDFRASRVGRRRSWYGLKRPVKRLLGLRVVHWFLRRVLRFFPRLRTTGRLPAPSRIGEVEGHIQGERFVMLRPDRCVVAKELYWGGGRRPRPQDDLAIELFATLARRSDVMLDIGAYTGLFTLVATAVNRDLRAHAFEIVPDVCDALRDNCSRNGVLDRVTVHDVGVGAPNAEITIPRGSGGSALPDFYSSRLHFDEGVRVRFRSLDSLAGLPPEGARVLIKIDVEGTENEVLRHGQGFLEAFRPDILCEVLHDVAEGAVLQGLLAPHGFRFYLVRENDLLGAGGIVPNPRFRDWLFTTNDPGEIAALGLPVAPAS